MVITDPTNTYATAMSKAALSNKDFYTISLGWDAAIWELDNLNLVNGRYPTLVVSKADNS